MLHVAMADMHLILLLLRMLSQKLLRPASDFMSLLQEGLIALRQEELELGLLALIL